MQGSMQGARSFGVPWYLRQVRRQELGRTEKQQPENGVAAVWRARAGASGEKGRGSYAPRIVWLLDPLFGTGSTCVSPKK